jgi:hypothetical protein
MFLMVRRYLNRQINGSVDTLKHYRPGSSVAVDTIQSKQDQNPNKAG